MDYFFDASAGVNFGGDFDFAPHSGTSALLSPTAASSSTTLPDFTSHSSHLDHHHPPPHHPTHTSSFAFYGSSDSSHLSTATDSGRFFPAATEYSAVSALVVPPEGAVRDASHLSSSSLSHPVASSSSSSSTHESRADSRLFHDSASVAVTDTTKIDLDGAHPEASSPETHSEATSSSSSSAVSDRKASSEAQKIDIGDSGVASSSSSSSASCFEGRQTGGDSHSPEAAASEEDAKEEEDEAEEEPTIDININNVVCSFSVRCHLNLRKVALEACNTEYNRNRACVKMKLRKPKITASIWNSGKITCIGATSEEDSKMGARRVARILMRMGFNVHFCRFRVVNVLASCTMPFAIRLHTFSAKYPKVKYGRLLSE